MLRRKFLQQLENNLEFFSNSSSDSPMVKDLSKKLELLQVKMEQMKSEGNALRSLVRKAKSAAEESAAPTEEDTTPEATPTQNDTPEETAPPED
jgi:ribosomal protein L18E